MGRGVAGSPPTSPVTAVAEVAVKRASMKGVGRPSAAATGSDRRMPPTTMIEAKPRRMVWAGETVIRLRGKRWEITEGRAIVARPRAPSGPGWASPVPPERRRRPGPRRRGAAGVRPLLHHEVAGLLPAADELAAAGPADALGRALMRLLRLAHRSPSVRRAPGRLPPSAAPGP